MEKNSAFSQIFGKISDFSREDLRIIKKLQKKNWSLPQHCVYLAQKNHIDTNTQTPKSWLTLRDTTLKLSDYQREESSKIVLPKKQITFARWIGIVKPCHLHRRMSPHTTSLTDPQLLTSPTYHHLTINITHNIITLPFLKSALLLPSPH